MIYSYLQLSLKTELNQGTIEWLSLATAPGSNPGSYLICTALVKHVVHGSKLKKIRRLPKK